MSMQAGVAELKASNGEVKLLFYRNEYFKGVSSAGRVSVSMFGQVFVR